MKTLEAWFSDYERDHQNVWNKRIHYVCVPLILYSVLGILDAVSRPELLNLSISLATITVCLAGAFYIFLHAGLGLFMVACSLVMILSFRFFTSDYELLMLSGLVFGLSWVGQFYGHILEGRKPSFFTDLLFFLIGPLWVAYSLLWVTRENQQGSQKT